MSETELRRALSALERKLDDIRAEVVTALREFKQGNKGSHAEFYRFSARARVRGAEACGGERAGACPHG